MKIIIDLFLLCIDNKFYLIEVEPYIDYPYKGLILKI
jgi:hypothetical protein